MRRQWLRFIVFLLILSSGGIYNAQEADGETPERVRSVAIISGSPINSATTSNIGADGISRLGATLTRLGATVQTIPPNEPIPANVELVVIIGPRSALSVQQNAYLWDFVANGGHLLLAFDPTGHNRVNIGNTQQSGLNRLLYADYGLSTADDFLIESWFSIETLSDVVTSWSEAHADDFTAHPIVAPLIAYDLPVRFWGGRSLFIDELTGLADTYALIYTENPHGETGRVNLNSDDPNQIARNIGQDRQGRLLLAGIAENFETGSRVALVGDSEIFRNIFGATRRPDNEAFPLYVGNDIFTQRLLAWLMGIPEDEWASVPDGFTWLMIDGDGADWPQNVPAVNVSSGDDTRFGLSQLRAFRNDFYVYLLLETENPPADDVTITFGITGDEAVIEINDDGLVFYDDVLVEDATAAFGEAVEIRLPRRLFGMENRTINRICFAASGDGESTCYEQTINPTVTGEFDPLPVRSVSGPQAFTDGSINVRTAPGTDSAIVASVPARTQFAIIGRNEAGDWLYVQNARYEGWIAEFVLIRNADISVLPVID